MTSGGMTPRANIDQCTSVRSVCMNVQCLRSVSFGGGLACGEVGRWVPGALCWAPGAPKGGGVLPTLTQDGRIPEAPTRPRGLGHTQEAKGCSSASPGPTLGSARIYRRVLTLAGQNLHISLYLCV